MPLTGSGGFTVELDKKYWAEFKRQVRAAYNELDDINHPAALRGKMREALTPLAERWRQFLPGSLKTTIKILPTSLTVRAGNASPHGDHPFLPWLEFGGTVKVGHAGRDRYPVPPHKNVHAKSGDWSARYVMFSNRDHTPFGVYRWPAIYAAKAETEQKVADAIQTMLDTTFHAP